MAMVSKFSTFRKSQVSQVFCRKSERDSSKPPIQSYRNYTSTQEPWRSLLSPWIVKELLGMLPELCKSCDSSNTSPLYSAAEKDHLEVVNAILDADVRSIRLVQKNGKTALHNDVRYSRLRVVKVLLYRNSKIVSIKDKKGQTALHMAVKGQDTSVIEDLLFYDHSILNERDNKGNTAVHIAARKCHL